MRIRKFEAETVREAMEQARRELGEDAVILNTREIRPLPGARGGSRPRVELVAATDTQAVSGPAAPGAETIAEPEDAAGIAAELSALRGALESLVGEGVLVAHTRGRPGPERRLRDAGVDWTLASQIARSLKDAPSLEEAAQQWACLFECARPSLPAEGMAAWAAVGPSGCGKTTVLAKMAAHYKLREGRSVAMLCCDGERIGASEQLSRIAGTLGATFRECFRAEAVSAALDELSDHDIVLVDCPGGSPRDSHYVQGLRKLLADERIACHLVLPASQSVEARAGCMQAFQALEPQRVTVTKLDETSSSLPLLAVAQSTSAPLAYLCEGPQIAGALREAIADEIAAMVLGELA